MYGQSTCRRAKFRFAAIDSGVSSGLPTMRPPTISRPCRCSTSMASSVAFVRPSPAVLRLFFAPALRKLEILFQHVLDPEKHVAEAGLLHERREGGAVTGKRRRHSLHDVIEVVQSGVDDCLA